MSIEEETIELSLAYHGLREENQELKSLLQEYHDLVAGWLNWSPKLSIDDMRTLQQRAKLFLGPAAGE